MKIMSEHEKEPWILGGCSGRMITTPDGYVGDGFIADVDTKANARRIVASVNACAGIPTEKLEGKTIAEYVSGEAYLRGMGINNGSLEIDINGLPCSILAASFAGQFVGSGAVNFLTIDMHHKSIGEFTITMQRSGGTTSADKLKVLKNQRDDLLSALEKCVDKGSHWTIYSDLVQEVSQAISNARGG